MTDSPQTSPAASAPPPAPSPPPRRSGGGFFGRLLAALLVIIITTGLALVATAAGLLSLGYTVRTPTEAAGAQARVATVEAQQLAVETRVAELGRSLTDERETLDELRGEMDAIRELRAQLEDQIQTGAVQNATLVADARLSRDQVLAFATTEAGRAALLTELERRSARIERFLARLSDIAEDTALDIGGLSPTPTPFDATGTPTPAPAEPTGTPTPAAEQSPAPTDESDDSETPIPSPAATATP